MTVDELTQLMHRQTRQLLQLNTQNEQLAVSVDTCSSHAVSTAADAQNVLLLFEHMTSDVDITVWLPNQLEKKYPRLRSD